MLQRSARLLPVPSTGRFRYKLLSTSRQAHNSSFHNSQSTTLPRAAAVALTVFAGATAAYFFWPDRYRGAPTVSNKPLSPTYFTPLTVTASEACGPSLKLLTLHVPPECRPQFSDLSILGPIWSIFVKDDDIQVERPYTPLKGIDDNGDMKLWVKKYQHGEVARWLHSKTPGEKVEVRGPLATMPTYDANWGEVVLISGGTGFSPFYQLLHHRLLAELSPGCTRYTLIHASRNQDELPPPEYLQHLLEYAERHPTRLRVHLFVEDLPEKPRYALNQGIITAQAIRDCIGLNEDNKASWLRLPWATSSKGNFKRDGNIAIAVCGPEPMVAAIAGPYGRNYSQGVVGGALSQLGFKSGEVYKL